MDRALPEPPLDASCVLCSGGLDSVVLLAWAAERAPAQPVYVRAGLAWEEQEITVLEKLYGRPQGAHLRVSSPPVPPGMSSPLYGRPQGAPLRESSPAAPVEGGLAARPARGVLPLVALSLDVRDLYPPTHWAIRGTPPAYDTPDEDVYLPGRNVLLLSKVAVLAASRGYDRVLVGPLAGNPFPDATAAFFAAMSSALSLGLAHVISVEAPFAALHKADVIRLGASLGVPLHATLSCMNPKEGVHCGLCSKCRERRDAFAEAGVEDLTVYAAPSPRGRTARLRF